jgi:carbonic anhydrase
MIWERDDISLPKFTLAPEGWVSRLGDWFRKRDIDFVESPDFSRVYQLKGADEQAVRALFTPELRRFFEATPNQKVNGGGSFLFWWFDEKLPSVERLDEWLEQGDHVRRRFFHS